MSLEWKEVFKSNIIYTCETPLHFNPLNAELNPICHLLTLLGAHHILHVSRIRVNDQFSLISLTTLPHWYKVFLE